LEISKKIVDLSKFKIFITTVLRKLRKLFTGKNKIGVKCTLKGLGHAILGNFNTNQMVIGLTKLSEKRLEPIEELKQDKGKPLKKTWMDQPG